MRFTANEDTWYKFPPLSFLLLGTSGDGLRFTLRATCRAPVRIWLAVIDFQKSIIVYTSLRADEIKLWLTLVIVCTQATFTVDL